MQFISSSGKVARYEPKPSNVCTSFGLPISSALPECNRYEFYISNLVLNIVNLWNLAAGEIDINRCSALLCSVYLAYDNLLIHILDRKEAAPRFIVKPHSVNAIESSTVNLHAAILSTSDPVVTWYHNDVQLSQSLKHMQRYQGRLSLSDVKFNKKSFFRYICFTNVDMPLVKHFRPIYPRTHSPTSAVCEIFF